MARWAGKGAGEGGSEGNGVSFRGIDVSQYRPDAVDTPICNPRAAAISAVAELRVPKVRQGESYSSPFRGSRGISGRPRALSRAFPSFPPSVREGQFRRRPESLGLSARAFVETSIREVRRDGGGRRKI